jgi:hypothetical protein
MAKTKKRWIYGTKRDSSNFTEYMGPQAVDALNANVIPYDSTTSVYEAINQALITTAGATGPQGSQGSTGPSGGVQGATGIQGLQGATGIRGPSGIQGQTGFGINGTNGATGLQGVTGLPGLGETGSSGPIGATGIQGQTGIPGPVGSTGNQGITGIIGSTGSQGLTGISAQTILFNPVSRYEVDSSSGSEVWVVSSSLVYNGIAWSRSGATLTVYRDAHGHSVGNRVIVRNANIDHQAVTIDSTTTNSFIITTTNTGPLSGNGAYSMGFTFSTIGSPKTGGQVFAPTGDHPDCQLLSMRIRTGTRAGTIYDLIVPASAINGAGGNTDMANCFVPDFNVRTDTDNLPAVAATISTNIAGSYSTFEFGNLGYNSISRIITVHF